VVDSAAVEALVAPHPQEDNDSLRLSQTFAEAVERRIAFLTVYQSKSYARRYHLWVEKVRAAEAEKAPGQVGLAEAVARYLFKLMAYKDEYEVARLYTDTSFIERVKSTFDGDNLRFEFHLAPPLLARRDKVTGEPKKMSFGPWLLGAFRMLAKFKFLRGTPLDPFGYTTERRTERRLVAEYCDLLGEFCDHLTPANHHLAVELASLPEKIRGFGHVKQRHLVAAMAEEAALREQFRAGAAPFLKAAE
jgi:indolepyruvate ferredoxin oxidoreductase